MNSHLLIQLFAGNHFTTTNCEHLMRSVEKKNRNFSLNKVTLLTYCNRTMDMRIKWVKVSAIFPNIHIPILCQYPIYLHGHAVGRRAVSLLSVHWSMTSNWPETVTHTGREIRNYLIYWMKKYWYILPDSFNTSYVKLHICRSYEKQGPSFASTCN